jgi:hypothetical protein
MNPLNSGKENSINEEGIKKPIQLPVTHNFIMFLIGVIVVGLVAFVSYTYLNITEPKQIISVEPSTQKNEFSDWKTYRNEEYGFEFKYPSEYGDFVIDDQNMAMFGYFVDKNGSYSHKQYFNISAIKKGYNSIHQYYLNVTDFTELSGNKFILSRNYGKDEEIEPIRKYELGGELAIKIKNEEYNLEYNENCEVDCRNVHGPNVVLVHLPAMSKYKVITFADYDESKIDQILSTFKFTNNYDTFDPDGTLSDISANSVFKNWINSKKVGYEQFEGGNFSAETIMKDSSVEIGKNFCNNSDSSKKFTNSSGDMVTCFFSGEEPDSDLYLYSRTDNSSRRIAFCGTPCHYETGFWLDNGKFVFLWTLSDYEYENNMRPYRELHVDLYNLEDNKIYVWKTEHLYK